MSDYRRGWRLRCVRALLLLLWNLLSRIRSSWKGHPVDYRSAFGQRFSEGPLCGALGTEAGETGRKTGSAPLGPLSSFCI